ncbi:MAG: hypothetical protein JWO11_3407 [Nocardioides sp.]|nr:hypothetical protein [Nocardioides sp.]
MIESTVSNQPSEQLTMHWVEVVDASGRRHLESHWSVPSQVVHATGTTHAA